MCIPLKALKANKELNEEPNWFNSKDNKYYYLKLIF